MRIALVDGVLFVAIAIGQAISGELYVGTGDYGYITIFSGSLGFHIISVLYMIFLVPESRTIKNKRDWESKSHKERDAEIERKAKEVEEEKEKTNACLDVILNIRDSFMTAFRKREGSLRHIIFLLICCYVSVQSFI